jgi:hypothetical protein
VVAVSGSGEVDDTRQSDACRGRHSDDTGRQFAMSLTGKPMPEFYVNVLRADDEFRRVPASTLVAGAPAVLHFYNAG